MVRPGWTLSAALVTAAILLTTASMASAEVVARLPYAPAQGPVIAGPRVLVTVSGPSAVTIFDAQAGKPALLATLPGEQARTDGGGFDARGVSASIAADAGGLVAAVRTQLTLAGGRSGDPGQSLLRIWAGTWGGDVRPVSGPCQEPNAVAFPGISSTTVTTMAADCSAPTIFDLVSGATRPLTPLAAEAVALSGDLVAWLERGSVQAFEGKPGFAVVADAATGQERYRVPIRFTAIRPVLGSDGTLVLVGPSLAGGAMVATLARPELRPVHVPAGRVLSGARLAGGRLAILTVPAGTRSRSRNDGEILVEDVDGGGARTVAQGVSDYGQDSFDFDGRRVVALSTTCTAVRIVRMSASAVAPALARQPRCPLAQARRPRWRDDGLSVALSCRGLSVRCTVTRITARVGSAHGRLLGRATERDATTVIPVRSAARHRYQHGVTRVWLQATLDDGTGMTTRTTTTVVPAR